MLRRIPEVACSRPGLEYPRGAVIVAQALEAAGKLQGFPSVPQRWGREKAAWRCCRRDRELERERRELGSGTRTDSR